MRLQNQSEYIYFRLFVRFFFYLFYFSFFYLLKVCKIWRITKQNVREIIINIISIVQAKASHLDPFYWYNDQEPKWLSTGTDTAEWMENKGRKEIWIKRY